MLIQGAFPVRWMPSDGAPGKDSVNVELSTYAITAKYREGNSSQTFDIHVIVTVGDSKVNTSMFSVKVGSFTLGSTSVSTNGPYQRVVSLNIYDGNEGSDTVEIEITYKGAIYSKQVSAIVIRDGEAETSFPNFTGIWDSLRTYSWDNVKRDFVDYQIDGEYYRFGVKSKGLVVPANRPPSTVNGDSNWQAGSKYQLLIANTFFADNANIGGFLTSNNMMKSQNDSLMFNGLQGTIHMKQKTGTEWHVRDDGTQILGFPEGQRIELNPNEKNICVYDNNGNISSIFEGNTYNNINKLFGSSFGTITFKTRTSTGQGGTSGETMAKGLITENNFNTDDSRSGTNVFKLTNVIHTDSVVRIQVSTGTLYVSATSGKSHSNGSFVTNPHASVSGNLRVATYQDSAMNNRIGYVNLIELSCYVFDGQTNNSTKTISNKSVITVGAGYHVLEYAYVWNVTGIGSSIISSWGSKSTSGVDISAPKYISDYYVSRYFANGFCLGQSEENYFWLRKNDDGNMSFEGRIGGNGFKVDGNGVMIMHNHGTYQKIPQIILWGQIETINSTSEPIKADIKTFDGSTFLTSPTAIANANSGTIKRKGIGKFTMTFPTKWNTLNLSPNVSFVTITGHMKAMKGTLDDFDNNSMGVSISDDDSLNDGTVFIRLEMLQ